MNKRLRLVPVRPERKILTIEGALEYGFQHMPLPAATYDVLRRFMRECETDHVEIRRRTSDTVDVEHIQALLENALDELRYGEDPEVVEAHILDALTALKGDDA